MRTVAFYTLGCKVNQYDTQAMREKLLGSGLVEAEGGDPADLVIVNTCSVTRTVEAKCRKAIRKARMLNPGAVVVAAGCYVNRDLGTLESLPEVDRVISNNEKDRVAGLLLGQTQPSPNDGLSGLKGRTRAFLKVQDGCDNSCSYCIVPRLRGKGRSRDVDEIIAEATRLAKSGFAELVLTGVNLGSFGGSPPALANLVRRLADVPQVGRIRLSSIDAADLTDELIDSIRGIDKLCEHFHVPLQSGDGRILKAMNRRYTTDEFIGRVDALKSAFDKPGITTDIIVGFPGEDDAAFKNTLEVVRQTGFSRVHVFTYSDRPGTPAEAMTQKVPVNITTERGRRLRELATETALAFAQEFKDRPVEVLVETSGSGQSVGYTRRYMRMEISGESEKGSVLEAIVEEPGSDVSRGRPLAKEREAGHVG